MYTTRIDKEEDGTTIYMETENIKTISRKDWMVLKDLVLSGINIFISEKGVRNSIQIRNAYGNPKNAVVHMHIGEFKMTSEIEKDSEYFFDYVDDEKYPSIFFGLWAEIELEPAE